MRPAVAFAIRHPSFRLWLATQCRLCIRNSRADVSLALFLSLPRFHCVCSSSRLAITALDISTSIQFHSLAVGLVSPAQVTAAYPFLPSPVRLAPYLGFTPVTARVVTRSVTRVNFSLSGAVSYVSTSPTGR